MLKTCKHNSGGLGFRVWDSGFWGLGRGFGVRGLCQSMDGFDGQAGAEAVWGVWLFIRTL